MVSNPNINVRVPAELLERLDSYVERVAATVPTEPRSIRAAVVAKVLAAGLDAIDKADQRKAKKG
jgi:hypothetical protein